MSASPPASSAMSDRVRRPWDVVLAIVLTVLVGVSAAVLGIGGALLAMASDPCGAVVCADDRLGAGVLVAMIGPAVVATVAVVALVERLVRARLAFWVPLVGFAVQALVWLGGAALVASAVPT